MKMNNSETYYKLTNNKEASGIIKRFFLSDYNKELKGNVAIDLGCGAGNDTKFLLEKGFNVIAIDQEKQVKDIIESKDFDKENLKIIIDDFSKIEIPKADLILANFSLFFVKENFEELVKRILKSINEKGFFVGNFLGKEDDWNEDITTIDKEELLKYFKNYKIFYFSEEEYYKKTVIGKDKFWHVYTIIAQKK